MPTVPDLMGELQRSLGLPDRPTEPPKHRPIERKVYVTVIEEDGCVDSVEEYREVCESCVPKYSAYKPWPCPFAATSQEVDQ